MPPVKSGQTFDFETFPPKPNGIDATAHLSSHGSLRLTFGQTQNDVSAADVFGGQTAATQLCQQFRFISGTHLQCVCHGKTIAIQCIRCQCYSALACYQTKESLFTQLYLHDNPGAGISLDLAFNHNVISNAVLTANNLGIFMRASRNNQFLNVTIHDNRQYGVFMAQAETRTALGWGLAPRTECADNLFNNLITTNCGGAAFHVNNANCTNNIISYARFEGNLQGDLALGSRNESRLDEAMYGFPSLSSLGMP
jgi:parallel beta-helix repeat protein